MRSVFVAILVSSTVLLAGCSDGGGDEDEHTYTCPDGSVLDLEQFPDHENATFNPLSKCPKTGSSTNTTSLAPNVLPTLVLTVMDDAGNVTPVTMLMGNLTFSAEGSSDSDGSITGIAVSVTDSNTTRTASLYDAASKSFKSATFKFDRPGVVNVTVAMVDDRAGFTVNQTNVYVNHLQMPSPTSISAPKPPEGIEACGGAQDLIEAPFYKEFSFAVVAGATWIEASATPSAAAITICAPKAEGEDTSEALSPTGNSVVTNDGVVLTPPVGISSYYLGATLGMSADQEIQTTVIVHYEPQAAAPAAEE